MLKNITMITVCLADNFPVVHFGIKSYFKDHSEIEIVSNVGSFYMVPDALRNKEIDVLVLDLEMDGLKSIYELRTLIAKFPNTKFLVFSDLNEEIYAPNAIKAGISGFVSKTSKLETLGNAIIRVHQGMKVISTDVKKKLLTISKKSDSSSLHKKLSNREIEVLRYISEGKKNNEIAKLLKLNEKTVSTYKLRLFQKMGVSNVIDLINKAKSLEILGNMA